MQNKQAHSGRSSSSGWQTLTLMLFTVEREVSSPRSARRMFVTFDLLESLQQQQIFLLSRELSFAPLGSLSHGQCARVEVVVG